MAAGPAAGDLLIAYVKATATTDISAAANGFTMLTKTVQAGSPSAKFWKIASGSEGTSIQPCTLTASKVWGCIIEQWTNVDGFPANPVAAENAQLVASTASYTTQTLAPSAFDGQIIAAGYHSANGARTWSAEAFSGANVGTVSEVGEQIGGALATAAIGAGSGNYSGSATLSIANAGADSIAIFKPNAPATKAPPPFSRPTRVWTRRR